VRFEAGSVQRGKVSDDHLDGTDNQLGDVFFDQPGYGFLPGQWAAKDHRPGIEQRDDVGYVMATLCIARGPVELHESV
jgi:hypothetical protein